MKIVAELPLRRPLPWNVLLRYLAPRLIAQVEAVDDHAYERRVDGGRVRVTLDAAGERLRIAAQGAVDAQDASARVARLFALDEDRDAAIRHLERCPTLGPRIAGTPGLRPLGSWDAFELCVRTVLGQQVTVAAAGTLMNRLVERCGSITPQAVLAAELSNMGMPGRRIDSVRALAGAVAERRVDLDAAAWQQIDAALRTVPGFGPWTRSYLAIRLGREPDAFPETDVGLIRAAGAASPADLLERAQAWRPYRALAAIYLWAG